MRQNVDPILVEEIDSDDEWIVEKEDLLLPHDAIWLEDDELFNVDGSGSRNKENEVNLALIDEDEELNDMGGFDSASFPTIDTLDEDDNDVREDDLN
ncbi:hypothetical protein CK203_060636 [Vitis vinifera]|uniref:Uncharacterized protein n=1 Tax=Vitis vinifera TaxID=29760 RepID=A0A438GEF0_VITVI|nr:hypothetical protein CK203_060636 [Vitis vinifera]